MTEDKPTIFFVHGAWHQGKHFDPIVKRLQADGFPAVCPTQPTYGRTGPVLKTLSMYDDADFVQAELRKLVEEQEKQVVVVLHSYAGVVGTQGISADLGQAQRAAQGKRGGVIRIAYMAAFIVPPGQSMSDFFGGEPTVPSADVAPDGSRTMPNARHLFYSLLDDEQAARWLSLTAPHVHAVRFSKVTHAAYDHHPTAYIVALQDPAIPAAFQRRMAKSAGIQDADVHEIDADHSPYLSRLDATAALLENIALTSRAAVS